MSRRFLSQAQLEEEALRGLSDEEDDPFEGSDESDYEPNSDSEDSSEKDIEEEEENHPSTSKKKHRHTDSEDMDSSSESEKEVEKSDAEPEATQPDDGYVPGIINWQTSTDNFRPRFKPPAEKNGTVLLDVGRDCSELDVFLKIFPSSLFMYVADCTNKRIDLLEKNKYSKQNTQHTDMYETMIVIGCTLVMSYNRVPSFSNYWSNNESLCNRVIKEAIGRDRCIFLLSKLYFAHPEKPADCSKTYYVDDVVECLKKRFQKARSASSHQSIDETMVKFKGRSSLKQYMPLKPTKRGIKIWQRCDSMTGYIYDFNIYCGKELDAAEGTLGERVVRKLCNTIRSSDVCLCFDRFFTSVELMNTLDFPCVGTYMCNRRNVPKFEARQMLRGDSDFFVLKDPGTMAVKWKDTKDVLVMSNCHSTTVGVTTRRLKNGEKSEISCPDAITFYNKYMGGVDLADQKISTYDLDRKSAKWWKKVFFKLLMAAVINSWIIFCEVKNKRIPLVQFLVPLAEQLISLGKTNATVKRRASGRSGRVTKRRKMMVNVGDHLPIQMPKRRRCRNCAAKKIESRTMTMCIGCNLPLCKKCFVPFHS